MKKVVLGVCALLLVSSASYAQDKKDEGPEEIKVTAADISSAMTAIKAVAGDSAKVKNYCEVLKNNSMAEEAFEKKDEKKAEELGKKAEEAAAALGEDFEKAMSVAAGVDPDDKKGAELFKALDDLDAKCDK